MFIINAFETCPLCVCIVNYIQCNAQLLVLFVLQEVNFYRNNNYYIYTK